MIATHSGGEFVRSGIYWSSSEWQFVAVPPEGGRLVGNPGDRFIRSPLPLVLIVGPLMGLAFAVFLPLSGLLVLIPLLAGLARQTLFTRRVGAAHMATPRTQPGMAYLKPPLRPGASEVATRAEPEDEGQEGKLFDLAAEIERMRRSRT